MTTQLINSRERLDRTMKFGELRDILIPLDDSRLVVFYFCWYVPDGFISYRSYYEHLALLWLAPIMRARTSRSAG